MGSLSNAKSKGSAHVLLGEGRGNNLEMFLLRKGNFIMTDEFRYGQTWKIWPSPLSLSLYSTFKTEEIMFRYSYVAKRVDPAVWFDGKNHLLEPDPTKMCIVWENIPNVELNYMITVLQPFMD